MLCKQLTTCIYKYEHNEIIKCRLEVIALVMTYPQHFNEIVKEVHSAWVKCYA